MKVYNKRDRNIPADAVYIGRPTKWGNPFVIGKDGTREEVCRKYQTYLLNSSSLMASLDELRGKDLVCHCAPLDCHGHVIINVLELLHEDDVNIALAEHKEDTMKPFAIAVTGHRLSALSPAQRDHAKTAMTELFTKAKAKYGDSLHVLIGMAAGIDQMAAQICVDLGIKWTACIPHQNYASNYGNGNDELLSKAFKVVYVCEGDWHWSMNFKRNEYMLKYADAVLACAKFDINNIPSKGGTAHMCRITQQAGKHIVHVKL